MLKSDRRSVHFQGMCAQARYNIMDINVLYEVEVLTEIIDAPEPSDCS